MPSDFATLNLALTAARKKVDEGGLYAIGPSYKEYLTFHPAQTH